MNYSVRSGSNKAMRFTHIVVVVASVLFVGVARPETAEADEAGKRATVVKTAAGGKLMITAKSVTYDFVKRTALFEIDVRVTDAQVMIDADRISVVLTEENTVSKVEAEGNVVIRELGTAKKATAGHVVYDMSGDTLVLTDNPRLEERDQGFYTKGADKITYFRKDQRFKAEGENMQLEFGIPADRKSQAGDLLRMPGAGKEKKHHE